MRRLLAAMATGGIVTAIGWAMLAQAQLLRATHLCVCLAA
jgi:hypothetical protein